MELPITEKELNTILSALRLGGDSSLYFKLWNYKMDYSNKNEDENGISK
jgi:hypothetical protein